jgi:hypothetical protein
MRQCKNTTYSIKTIIFIKNKTMNEAILAYHAAFDPEDQAICAQLYETITQQLPNVECKIWHAIPVWFVDGNPIVGYGKLKGCIRLLFWSGQSFDEAGLKNEGKFKAAEKRYTSVTEIDQDALKRWLEKAVAIQWDYKNIIKRKGVLEKRTTF